MSGSVIGSAEGRYKHERNPDTEQQPRPIPPDERDGELVDKAVRALSQDHRFLLKFTYVYPRPAGWVMRKLGRRADAFKAHRMGALLALSHALDTPVVTAYKQTTSITPSDARLAPVGEALPEETEPVE